MADNKRETLLEATEAMLLRSAPRDCDGMCYFCGRLIDEGDVHTPDCEWLAVERATERERAAERERR
jgi:hypothetical protein